MANINLNNGHRYTFGKINDNAVLSESTDFVQETAVFRQGIQATGSVVLDAASSTDNGFRLLNGNENLANLLLEYGDSAVFSLYDNNVRKVRIGSHVSSPDNYINNGANFGFGTDSPDAKLHIKGDGTNRVAIFESTDGTVNLQLTDSNVTSSIKHDSTRMAMGYKVNPNDVDNLVIKQNGNVGIGDHNPGRKFVVKDNTAGTTNPVVLVENAGSGTFEGIRINFSGLASPGNAAQYLSFFGNGAELDTIRGDGSGGVQFTGTLFTSEMRNKANVVYLTNTSSSLDVVNNLDVIEFEYKTDTADTPKRRIGFSAQQLLDIYPHPVVTFDEENQETGLEPGEHGFRYHKVDMAGMTPLLTQAIKELTSEIESLKARIQELENK